MLKAFSLSPTVMLLGGITLAVAACGDVPIEPPPPPATGELHDQRIRERFGSLTGDGNLFSLGRDDEAVGGGGGIGVNAYIWQATLDTIDFIPLASADPFGGLIITEWYQAIDVPGERLKVTVQIRDATLRADAVKVTVFRQVRDEAGDWLDAPVEPATGRTLEDHILTRARELRVASAEAG